MNGLDIILILLIGAAVVLAARKIRRDFKEGNACSCGGGSSCSGCTRSCGRRKDNT